jgi:hypothetical protein
LAAALLIRPFFWYPTRWNDRREQSVVALVDLIRVRQPAVVIQDIASALEVFGQLRAVAASWCWAHDFQQRVAAAPHGALVVLETDPRGQPLARYPQGLLTTLTHSCAPVAQFASPPGPAWLHVVDRIAARNRAVHWTACRMR